MSLPDKIHSAELALHVNTLQHVVQRLDDLRLQANDPAAQAKLARRMRLYKSERQRVLAGSATAIARTCDYHTRFGYVLHCFRNDLAGSEPRHPVRPFKYKDYMPLAAVRDMLAKIRTLPEYKTKPLRRIVSTRRTIHNLAAG